MEQNTQNTQSNQDYKTQDGKAKGLEEQINFVIGSYIPGNQEILARKDAKFSLLKEKITILDEQKRLAKDIDNINLHPVMRAAGIKCNEEIQKRLVEIANEIAKIPASEPDTYHIIINSCGKYLDIILPKKESGPLAEQIYDGINKIFKTPAYAAKKVETTESCSGMQLPLLKIKIGYKGAEKIVKQLNEKLNELSSSDDYLLKKAKLNLKTANAQPSFSAGEVITFKPKYITIQEAIETYKHPCGKETQKLSYGTIYGWIKQGKIKTKEWKNKTRINVDSLEQLLKDKSAKKEAKETLLAKRAEAGSGAKLIESGEYLSSKQVQNLLGIAYSGVHYKIKAKHLNPIRKGKCWAFPRKETEEYARMYREGTAPKTDLTQITSKVLGPVTDAEKKVSDDERKKYTITIKDIVKMCDNEIKHNTVVFHARKGFLKGKGIKMTEGKKRSHWLFTDDTIQEFLQRRDDKKKAAKARKEAKAEQNKQADSSAAEKGNPYPLKPAGHDAPPEKKPDDSSKGKIIDNPQFDPM